MQLQLKVVLLVGLLVAAVVTAIAIQTGNQMREDKAAQVAAQFETQLAATRRLVQAKLDLSKEQLIQFTRRKESGANVNGAFGNFDVIGLAFESGAAPTANAGGASGSSGHWVSKWISLKPDVPAGKFDEARERVLLASLPYNKLRDGNVQWVWRLDKKEGPLFVLMVPIQIEAAPQAAAPSLPDQPTQNPPAPGPQRAIAVGIFSVNPLAVATEDFVGQANSVFIVDDAGYVASHSNKTYTGSLFSEDDMVKEIKTSGNRVSNSGAYENLDGEKVFGRWEKIEGTNLFTLISTPQKLVKTASSGVTQTIVLFGALGTMAAMVLAFVIARFLSGGTAPASSLGTSPFVPPGAPPSLASLKASGITLSEDSGVKEAPTVLKTPVVSAQAKPAAPQASSGPATPAKVEPAAPEEAYRLMAQSLSQELRKPLASLMGHVRLLNEKTEGEANDHSQSIEGEARHLREVIEALTEMGADEATSLEPSSLIEVVKIAATHIEKDLGAAGVNLKLQTDEASAILASPVHLQKAIEAVCRQAIEALRTRPGKDLTVRVFDNDGHVRLQIRDSGIGVDRDQAARYFQPFFQPYEGAPSPGVRLAMAHAVFTHHHGEVQVESIPGVGTTVTVDFPASAVKVAQNNSTSAAAEPIATPPEISMAPPTAPAPKESLDISPPPIIEPPSLLDDSGLKKLSFAENETPPKIEFEPPPPFKIEDEAPLKIGEEPEMPAGFTLGGKAPVAPDLSAAMPPPPDFEGLSSAAFDLKLMDTPPQKPAEENESAVGEKTAVVSNGGGEHFSASLPPLDLSRTEAPPENMRELALPDLDLGNLGGGDMGEVDLSMSTQPDIGVDEPAQEAGHGAGASSSGFQVKIRRPKPKG